jgi:hypothetical protein
VPPLPPELAQPFHDQRERAAARHRLAERDRTLHAIEALSRRPASAWTSHQRGAFPSSTNGIAEPPDQRLGRWASLFAEELTEVHHVAATARPLSDLELQEVLYLAGRLLSTVTGLPISQVDDFQLH